MRRLGCLTPLGIISGVIAVLALTGVALATGGMMFNPGPLNAMGRNSLRLGGVASHAEIGGRCSACHTPPWGGEKMEQRCLACHTNIQTQIQDPAALHGALPEGLLCRSCHTEHKGPQAALTRMDFKTFPHEVLGFSLAAHQTTSASQPFACADCHVQDLAHLDRTLCETCHRNYQANFVTSHIANFGNDCMSCHNGADRFSKRQFNHLAFTFALAGKHADVQCTLCHSDARALADFKNAPQQCIDCHRQADAHKGEMGADCAKCHTSDDWKKPVFDHNQSIFKLTGKHNDVTCARCHVNNVFKNIAQQCVDCHRDDDPHKGALGGDCAKCHTPDDWNKTAFDHNQSVFKLTGKHVSVECAQCHTDKIFKGAPRQCADCHRKDDPHQGKLGECARCHTTDDWKKTTFDHSQSAFKLTGLHANVTCDKCHADTLFKGTPQVCLACHRQVDPHQGVLGECARCHTPAGWKPTTFNHNQSTFKLMGQHSNTACARCHTDKLYKGTPQLCVDCHRTDDSHQGVLGVQCARCHTPAGWKPSTFDHNQSAFKLIGQHSHTACARCHTDKLFKGAPQNCVDCHRQDDAHAGQFGANCAQCHTPAGWKPATFDHNRAAFKLTGAHANAACTRCHINGVFKGTPQNCVDCHRKNDAHNGSLGANCAQCHSTAAWKPSTFNHNQAPFKLTGAHVNVACARCHTNGDFKSTPQNCVDCHRQRDAHNGSLGTNCAQCHSTAAWKPSTFDHNRAAFKLTGAHVNVACARCHVSGVFKGTPQTCVSCHAEPAVHRGQFGTDCKQCHSTTTWQGAVFNHRFPLNHGGRGAIPCATCHTTPGNYRAYTCYGCHNQAEIQRKHVEHGIPNYANCVQCHPTGRGG